MASLGGKGLKDRIYEEYISHIRTSACQAVVMIDLNPSIKVTIHLTIFCKHILSVHKCKILYKCCVTLIDFSCNIVAFENAPCKHHSVESSKQTFKLFPLFWSSLVFSWQQRQTNVNPDIIGISHHLEQPKTASNSKCLFALKASHETWQT